MTKMSPITKDTRSLDQIEAQLDEDRAELASSLSAMRASMAETAQTAQAKLSNLKVPERAKTGVATVWGTVKANPLAVGMTAAGVFLLVRSCLSSAKRDMSQVTAEIEAIDRWADDGGPLVEADPLIAEAEQLRESAVDLASQARKPLQSLKNSARQAADIAGTAAQSARQRASDVGAKTVGAHPFLWAAGLAAAGASIAWALPQAKREADVVAGAKRRAQSAGRVVLNTQRTMLTDFAIALAAASVKDLLLTPRTPEAAAPQDPTRAA